MGESGFPSRRGPAHRGRREEERVPQVRRPRGAVRERQLGQQPVELRGDGDVAVVRGAEELHERRPEVTAVLRPVRLVERREEELVQELLGGDGGAALGDGGAGDDEAGGRGGGGGRRGAGGAVGEERGAGGGEDVKGAAEVREAVALLADTADREPGRRAGQGGMSAPGGGRGARGGGLSACPRERAWSMARTTARVRACGLVEGGRGAPGAEASAEWCGRRGSRRLWRNPTRT